MKLYIKQKIFAITDRYNIFSSDESLAFNVKSEFFSIGAKFWLCNLEGEELFFIKQKLMSFLPQYEIYKGEHLCAVIHKQLTFFTPKLDISSEYGRFEVVGDFFGMDFKILLDGELFGSINKQWLTWGDAYELDIADGQDVAFFCCLVIAIDHCLHNESDS